MINEALAEKSVPDRQHPRSWYVLYDQDADDRTLLEIKQRFPELRVCVIGSRGDRMQDSKLRRLLVKFLARKQQRETLR